MSSRGKRVKARGPLDRELRNRHWPDPPRYSRRLRRAQLALSGWHRAGLGGKARRRRAITPAKFRRRTGGLRGFLAALGR